MIKYPLADEFDSLIAHSDYYWSAQELEQTHPLDTVNLKDFVINYRGRLAVVLYKDKNDHSIVAMSNRLDDLYLTKNEYLPITLPDSKIKNLLESWKERINRGFGTTSNVRLAAKYIFEKYPEIYESVFTLSTCAICHKKLFLPEREYHGKYYCQPCFEMNFFRCSHCSKILPRTEAKTAKDGYCYCKPCSKRHFVLPYHHGYPSVTFYGDNQKNKVPYMGMELEVDVGGEDDHAVAQIMPIMNNESKEECFIYCSHDSSLDNGFEIITQPATMQYHYSIKGKYEAMASKLKAKGFYAHTTGTCGLHIHFNRNYFADAYGGEYEATKRFVLLVDKFWDELTVYGRRPNFRLQRYAKKLDMPVDRFMRKANKSGSHDYRYYAVNITNESTIEIRLFRSTLNVNTVMATLQLIDNMAIWCKNNPTEKLDEVTFETFLTTTNQRRYWARQSAIRDFEE